MGNECREGWIGHAPDMKLDEKTGANEAKTELQRTLFANLTFFSSLITSSPWLHFFARFSVFFIPLIYCISLVLSRTPLSAFFMNVEEV